MTTRFSNEAENRDEQLVKALCYSIHRHTLQELREWIQAELVALINAAELQEIEIGGIVAEGIREKIDRLRTINRLTMPNAIRQYSQIIDDIDKGGWDDVHDAYTALQKECTGMVNILEELVEIRKLIEPMIDEPQNEEAQEEDWA